MTFNRMFRSAFGAAVTVVAMAGSVLAAGGTPKEAGVWYDDTGKGAVKVELCGDKLCGHIYWLKEPLNAEGKPLRDKHNPNEGQQNRPICGLQVIGALAHMDDGQWDTGWIYDPKEGKSYSVALTMTDPNTLKVTGYLVMKMMGRTLTWTRAPADLPSCVTNAAAAPAGAGPSGKTTMKAPSKVAAPLPVADEEAAVPQPPAKAKASAAKPKTVAEPIDQSQDENAATDGQTAAPPAKTPATSSKANAAAPVAPKTGASKSAASPAKSALKEPAGSAATAKPAAAKAKGDPAAKTASKPQTAKTAAAKDKNESLPWSQNKKAPAEDASSTTEALNTDAVKPVRAKAPDEQARPSGTE